MAPESSSSSVTEPAEPTVAGLLAESFRVLAVELPPAWERFCAALDGCAVEIHVDAESFVVRFAAGRARVAAIANAAAIVPADARIDTTRRTIEDVLDARLSLREAVMRDALQVIAPLAVMSRLHTGILGYVHGGVRCPSFPALLKRFRALPAPSDTEPGSVQ
jgi:hypothetical protein